MIDEYQTRRMTALRPITHMSAQLQPGDEFYASAVDCGYYVKHGRAQDLGALEVQPFNPPAGGEPAQPVAPSAPVAGGDVAEPAAAPRRRGRPPRAAAPVAPDADTEA